MKFKNLTNWNTRDLIRLIKACFKETGIDSAGYRVTLRQKAHCWGQPEWFEKRYSGLGSYPPRKEISMVVPAPKFYSYMAGEDGKDHRVWEDCEVKFNSIRFAQVLIHEVDHTKGLHHRDMIKSTQIDADWVKGFTVGLSFLKPAEEERCHNCGHYTRTCGQRGIYLPAPRCSLKHILVEPMYKCNYWKTKRGEKKE